MGPTSVLVVTYISQSTLDGKNIHRNRTIVSKIFTGNHSNDQCNLVSFYRNCLYIFPKDNDRLYVVIDMLQIQQFMSLNQGVVIEK